MTSLVRAVRVVGRKKCRNFVKLVRLMSFSALLYLSHSDELNDIYIVWVKHVEHG